MKNPLVIVGFAAGVVIALAGQACATSKEAQVGDDVRVAPKEGWREARPVAGAAAELKLPAFQKAELRNGLTLILVEDHALPTVHAAVVIKAGAAHDGKESGLANLTYDVLDEGAGRYNAAGLANAFGDIGSEVLTTANRESGWVGSDFLKQHADKGFELLATVVQKPAFAQSDFDRVKKLHIDALKAKEGEPDVISDQVMAAEVFGLDHPYGRRADGNAITVEKLKLSSVKKFWSDFAGPKNSALVLTGDLTLEEAKVLAERHFGKWKGGSKTQKAPLLPKAKTGVNIYVIDFAGAPQTQIRVGRALLAAGDPDEPAMTVMNQVLGGMFTSRLNLKLREEKQWTYGAFSGFDPRLGPGPFIIGADVQTQSTGDALKEVFEQIDTLKTGGVTDEELELGKQNFVKSIPGLFALAPLQAGVASELFVLGLPLDHHARQLTAVNDVTAAAVSGAAQRALVKEDFVVVLVGDRAAIESGLKDKNLGDIVFLNKDGTAAK